MPDTEQRMAQQHARPYPAHHHTNLFTHRRAVAMHNAIGTGRLRVTKHATRKTARCILHQGAAIRAQPFTSIVRAVVTVAAVIQAHHHAHGFQLTRSAHAAVVTDVGNILELHEQMAIRVSDFPGAGLYARMQTS